MLARCKTSISSVLTLTELFGGFWFCSFYAWERRNFRMRMLSAIWTSMLCSPLWAAKFLGQSVAKRFQNEDSFPWTLAGNFRWNWTQFALHAWFVAEVWETHGNTLQPAQLGSLAWRGWKFGCQGSHKFSGHCLYQSITTHPFAVVIWYLWLYDRFQG